MPFSSSTFRIKLGEIVFSEVVRIDFLHMFFPGNETRRNAISKTTGFLNIAPFLFNVGKNPHPSYQCVGPGMHKALGLSELTGDGEGRLITEEADQHPPLGSLCPAWICV